MGEEDLGQKHLRRVLECLRKGPLETNELVELLWRKLRSPMASPLIVRQTLAHADHRGLVERDASGDRPAYALTQKGKQWLKGKGLKRDLQLSALINSIAPPMIVGVSVAVIVSILRMIDNRSKTAATS